MCALSERLQELDLGSRRRHSRHAAGAYTLVPHTHRTSSKSLSASPAACWVASRFRLCMSRRSSLLRCLRPCAVPTSRPQLRPQHTWRQP